MGETEVNNARAIIENGAIVIRVSLKSLPQIVEGSWTTRLRDVRYKVTNITEFADALVDELNSEEEGGTTRIHRMFDGAIDEAIDQGAFGIEEHEDQNHD